MTRKCFLFKIFPDPWTQHCLLCVCVQMLKQNKMLLPVEEVVAVGKDAVL